MKLALSQGSAVSISRTGPFSWNHFFPFKCIPFLVLHFFSGSLCRWNVERRYWGFFKPELLSLPYWRCCPCTRERAECHPVSSLSCHLQYLCSALRQISYLQKRLRATQFVVGIKCEKQLFTVLNVLHVTAQIRVSDNNNVMLSYRVLERDK